MSTGPAWRDAKWCVHEDGARLQLQLELGNGRTVLLAGWKDDGELDVALYEAGAGHARDLRYETMSSFRRWLVDAQRLRQ